MPTEKVEEVSWFDPHRTSASWLLLQGALQYYLMHFFREMLLNSAILKVWLVVDEILYCEAALSEKYNNFDRKKLKAFFKKDALQLYPDSYSNHKINWRGVRFPVVSNKGM